MLEDLQARGKRVETADDEQLLKCSWVRQAIHGELDTVREQSSCRPETLLLRNLMTKVSC